MQTLQLRLLAFAGIFSLSASLLNGQAQFVNGSRYLYIQVSNNFGASYLDDKTAAPSGYYGLRVAGTSSAGTLDADQATTIDDSGAYGDLNATSAHANGFTGTCFSKLLADYSVSKPSKYSLHVTSKNSTDNNLPNTSSIASVALGPPNPNFGLALWTSHSPFYPEEMVSPNTVPNSIGSENVYTGILQPGIWRLAIMVLDQCPGIVDRKSSTSATIDFLISAIEPAVIRTQPAGKDLFPGDPIKLNVVATGDFLTYQWKKDGVVIPGATSATLDLGTFNLTQTGNYTVTLSNQVGSLTSDVAALALANPGRLINLSILTSVSVDDPGFTMGFVIVGKGTNDKKNTVIRAAGPSLTPFGLTTVLPDPKFDLFSGSAIRTTNDNWGGGIALKNSMAQVGAFAFLSDSSKDASVATALDPGAYTVQVSDASGGTGSVIAELYDATSGSNLLRTTPRLANVSVLKKIPAGDSLTAGFVVGGASNCSVLIRVMGPSLAKFGVGDPMSDPQLALYRGQTQISANDNWGGAPAVIAAGTAVGAFAPVSETSKDAILVANLSPGSYTVQARGVGNSVGYAIIEIYEISSGTN